MSPLILDLDGQGGAETLGKSTGIHFDHDGNKFAEQTGWVGQNDGLLVWDRNGNGQIDNGAELFGNNTVLKNGSKAANGFAGLAELDGKGADILNGGNGSDTYIWSKGDGNDVLDGQAGNDVLAGGAGNDVYQMGRGYGADTIQENDAKAGNTDVLQFMAGVNADQLWFRKAGNNLEASIIGTADKAVVKDWYLGSAYHVEQIKAGDGKVLLDTQVDKLVQAMAGFTPPAMGQTTLTAAQQTALAPVLAANWH